MCGIVGYIGGQKASPILLSGLMKLEYRGYDSAGIATLEDGTPTVVKNTGRVRNLYQDPQLDALTGTVGIAHTRWATHGKPSKENSHPHLDSRGVFTVVHNGIIENYEDLRSELELEGCTFKSETDTEVIPNLIAHYYFADKGPAEERFLRATQRACKRLEGSYAIEVLCSETPDQMIVVRKSSPLVIGIGYKENYIASDIPAILSYTKDFYLLNDQEYAVITRENITFYDEQLHPFEKKHQRIDWDATAAEKNGYPDFMLKEMYEQPSTVRETIGTRVTAGAPTQVDGLDFTAAQLQNLHQIYIIGCGTAMHAGLAAKPMFEHLTHIPTQVDVASEFRYRDPLVDDRTLCIFISQSGETADTIAALRLAKAAGAATLAVSNVIGSSITREADYTVYTHAGPEIAVASTKAYTAQVVLLAVLAIHFAELLGLGTGVAADLKADLLELPALIEETLKCAPQVKAFADKIHRETDVFFIGRGSDYTTSLEASLKLKEISYIHSEAYPSGELKHGPIALIEKGTTVIGTITDPALVDKSVSNLKEVITRGAKVLVVTNRDVRASDIDTLIRVPETHPLLAPAVSILPYQLLSYYIAKQNGLDVDKPRNLAKSVTVE